VIAFLLIICVITWLGYGLNIYKLIKENRPQSQFEKLIRVIGVAIFPVGALIGYFGEE
jgi:hypothetical protein